MTGPRVAAERRELTAIELEVLRGVALGLSNNEIGKKVHRSSQAVASCLGRIRVKLDCQWGGSRSEMVTKGFCDGILRTEDFK